MEDVQGDYARKAVIVGEERVFWDERSLEVVQELVILELHSNNFQDRPVYLSGQAAQAIEYGQK